MTPVPVVPPMLARMPERRLMCTYGSSEYCTEPAVAEEMVLWPQHQDDNLARLAEIHMRPLCDKHLAVAAEIYNSVIDGSMFIVRRLAARS